jgi:hypothetical protein
MILTLFGACFATSYDYPLVANLLKNKSNPTIFTIYGHIWIRIQVFIGANIYIILE